MIAAISGVLVIPIFLLATWVIFGGLLDTATDQADALREATERHEERLRARVSIPSASLKIVSLGTGKCTKSYLAVDTLIVNSGDVSVTDFSKADLVLAYTGDTGTKVAIHPKYLSTGSLSANQWTVSAISGDNFGVSVWDPDETATLRARPLPLPQPNSLGTVLLATPHGVTASAYVDFDYDAPVSNDCRYLHNNPSPPTGDTDLQPLLSMNETVPTATTLYNYDKDVDPDVGRTIAKGAIGTGETDTKKYQDWRTGALAEPLALTGTVSVDIWGAIQNYQLNKAGIVTIYFRDYNGSTHTDIAHGTIFDNDWQGGVTGDFVRKVVLIPGFNYTVPAGNELEVKMIVGSVAGAEMWFAYDTQSRQSLINLSYAEPTFTTLYYIHDNPTPPTGDRDAQAVLPMNATAPTAATLYNYDQNYNSDAGRTLQKTPQGLNESGLQKHQVWRSGALAGDLAISGDVSIDLWAAPTSFDQDKSGIVTAYLRDYDGATHEEIGRGTVYAEDWQDGSGTWVKRSIYIPDLNHTISSGDELELFMVVENNADGDMMFAYDTTSYAAVIKIP